MRSFNRTPYPVYLFCTFINFLGEMESLAIIVFEEGLLAK